MKKYIFNRYKFISDSEETANDYLNNSSCRAWVDACHNQPVDMIGIVGLVVGSDGYTYNVVKAWCDEMEVL
jgi:hypothetical protein